MNLDIPKIINEHHEMMVEKGFFECPDCKGKGIIDKIGSKNEIDFCSVIECSVCQGTGIDPNKNIGEMIMQIVSEIGEAYEAHRKGIYSNADIENINLDQWDLNIYKRWYEKHISHSFEDEIADIFLSIFNLCGYLGIEPDGHRIIVGDYKYWEGLTNSNNVGESLMKITLEICNIYTYKYLKSNKYKSTVTEYFNRALWRLYVFCKALNIPIEKHILAKMQYNKTRPYKHGKEY